MLMHEYMLMRLDERRLKGNLRALRVCPHTIDFTSNDYLGLARNLELKKSIDLRLAEYDGCSHGSTGSRLLTGHSTLSDELEDYIASFHRSESALLYTCGYMANIGLVDALLEKEDTLIYDSHIHASFRDGIRLAQAKAKPFFHNDLNHLEKRLKNSYGKVIVCIESVYSLDGSIAPIHEICELCAMYKAFLIVDEAHAVGIFGKDGRGLIGALELEEFTFARIYTFGKAMGVHGAAVVGSRLLREYLTNFSRPLCYTTAMPPHAIIAISAAYAHMRKANRERERLSSLIAYFRDKSKSLHIPISNSLTPIQAIPIPGNKKVRATSLFLAENGFDVRPIMSPTVRRGHELLRINIHAFNTTEEIEKLIHALGII